MNNYYQLVLLCLLGACRGVEPPEHGWKGDGDDRVEPDTAWVASVTGRGTEGPQIPPHDWTVRLDDLVEPAEQGSGQRERLSSYGWERRQGKRIIYGEEAAYGDHPYVCSLQLRQWGFWFHICGAVIYNARTLLTAAHCVQFYGAHRLRVRCGEHNLHGYDSHEVTRSLEATLLHPDYSNSSTLGFPNDLALLKTSQPMDLKQSPYLRAFPIDDGTDTNLPVNCSLSGWGRTETGLLPSVLQEVHIDRLTNAQCSQRWGSLIQDGHVCFKNPYSATSYEGSCSGDSGGPATCGDVIVGVTSWGISNCMTRYYPSVYTRLSHYYQWIVSHAF